jgi:hypothetical protein
MKRNIIAIIALVLSVAALGGALTVADVERSPNSTQKAQTTEIAQLKSDVAGLKTDVTTLQGDLVATQNKLTSVQATAKAAFSADLGYCVEYTSVTYVDGYVPDGNGDLDQENLYYPSDISTPSVNSAGVVSCPSGNFTSVVPTKNGN